MSPQDRHLTSRINAFTKQPPVASKPKLTDVDPSMCERRKKRFWEEDEVPSVTDFSDMSGKVDDDETKESSACTPKSRWSFQEEVLDDGVETFDVVRDDIISVDVDPGNKFPLKLGSYRP